MSTDWGADEDDVDIAIIAQSETVDEEPGAEPVLPGVADAMAQLVAAQEALASAEDKVDAAEDAQADAVDAVAVASAKAEDYATDESKERWQREAAARDVGKTERALDRAGRAVARAHEVLAAAQRAVGTAQTALDHAMHPPTSTEAEEPELYYGSVDEFVREYLRQVYRRRIDGRGQGRVWAAEWWRYDEAVIRLEALWRAWEHLRQDPALGMSVWWRDHADHHMAVLMDPDGPFGRAQGERDMCRPGAPLPYVPPPDGMFPDVRDQTPPGETNE